jgi:hypothetical protein
MPPSPRRRLFPSDAVHRAPSPPQPRWPIQPPAGEYAIAALEHAKRHLVRTSFADVLLARADVLTREELRAILLADPLKGRP